MEYLLTVRSLRQRRTEFQFDLVRTSANPAPIFNGRFGAIHDQFRLLNPGYGPNGYRLHHYVACWFAMIARKVPGDYLISGVSYGASAKVIYEFVNFPTLNKTYHLVDPLDGKVARGAVASNYNSDPERVLALFNGGPVKLHRQQSPIKVGPLAFVYGDTGDVESDVNALPSFYEQLSPGGVLVSNLYGIDTAAYRSTLERLRIAPLWLPNGQGVIIKS
jgi:hypothetical protein